MISFYNLQTANCATNAKKIRLNLAGNISQLKLDSLIESEHLNSIKRKIKFQFK